MTRTGDGNASDPASPRPPEPDTRDLGPPDDEPPRQPPPRPVLFGGDMRLILRRVGAWLIDFTIAYFVVYVAVSIAGVAPTAEAAESDVTGLVVWLLAVPFVYRWAMQSALGYTLGKLGMGLRLVDRDGRPPGPIAVLNREAVQLVLLFAWQVVPQPEAGRMSIVTTLLILAVLGDVYSMFRRRDSRALHDLPAGTQVIRVARGAARDGPRRFS